MEQIQYKDNKNPHFRFMVFNATSLFQKVVNNGHLIPICIYFTRFVIGQSLNYVTRFGIGQSLIV